MIGKIPEDTKKLLLMHARDKDATTLAILAIENERQRQIETEGFHPEDDTEYTKGELVAAAECYYSHALRPALLRTVRKGNKRVPVLWPWYPRWWKPKTPERDLERAGALCLAECDRVNALPEREQRHIQTSPQGQRMVLCLGSTLAALEKIYILKRAQNVTKRAHPDICPGDGKSCYVGGEEDAHARCGTVQCGQKALHTNHKYDPIVQPFDEPFRHIDKTPQKNRIVGKDPVLAMPYSGPTIPSAKILKKQQRRKK